MTKVDGNSVFEISSQEERLKFIEKRISETKNSIADDLSFGLLPSFRDKVSGHDIRIIPSYSGFRMVLSVKSSIDADGNTRYRPAFPFASDFAIPVIIRRKSFSFDSITNLRQRQPIPAVVYLTNDSIAGARTFPYLSRDIAPYDVLTPYEQGELAAYGVNDLRAFYRTPTQADQWIAVRGVTYVNELDRMIIPPAFEYTFSANSQVVEGSITLSDSSGAELQTVRRREVNPFSSIGADFSPSVLPDRWNDVRAYEMEIRTNYASNISRQVIFSSDRDVLSAWALLNIKPVVSNSDYSLLDENGHLKTRLNSERKLIGVPTLEIPIKGRISYWKYINELRKALVLNPEWSSFLERNEEGALVTILPRPAVLQPQFFYNASASKIFLPGPGTSPPVVDKGAWYSNIVVPASDKFQVET